MNTLQAQASYLTWIDYSIILVYLLGTVAIGTWFHRRQKSTEDYFVASRRMHWIPLALSIWSGLTSANSMIGGPGYAYAHDLQQVWIVGEAMLVYVVVIYFVLPIIFPLKLTTAYTYLEMRFNLATRLFGSALFILLRFSWLAAVMYAPSKAIAAIIKLPLSEQWMQTWSGIGLDGATAAWVLIIGLTTTLYATLGGMEGVIWTDFLQALIMMGGLVTILVLAINGLPEGVVTLYQSLANNSHGRLFDFSLDMRERDQVTFWLLLAYSITARLNDSATDQVALQRYFSAKSIRDCKGSLWLSGVCDLLMMPLIWFLGAALWVYFLYNPDPNLPLGANGQVEADQVFPYFVAKVLPVGLSGIFLATILSATMSSVSAGINSLSAALVTDFYRRLIRPDRTDEECTLVAKKTTIAWGAAATVVGLFLGWFEQIWQIAVVLMGFWTGPLLGIFMLGYFTKRANGRGVLVGAVCGLLCTILWAFGHRLFDSFGWTFQGHGFMFGTVGLIPTLIVGYLVSLGSGVHQLEEIGHAESHT